VLAQVKQKFQTIKSLQSDYELAVEDRKEKTRETLQGNLTMKQNKYKITSSQSVIWFNGTTLWSYSPTHHEVTISSPQPETEDFMSHPSTFFNSYTRDFKYRYVQLTSVNGMPCHEIDLFPKNLNQPYSRIKVLVNIRTKMPLRISSIGKDGVDYIVTFKTMTLDMELSDSLFTFDASKYRKVETIDMRGLE
jgi:outer membrane lipoprotein-sorting protein